MKERAWPQLLVVSAATEGWGACWGLEDGP